ncbi:MAG: 2-amino-3,7-dideoxy-D-threo-hept-6-ulosonate synthase [Candidatus Helarchaeales archaeon]
MEGTCLNGKQIRLSRILDDGKAIIIPMDHGVTLGPIPGIIDINVAVSKVVDGGATAILLHKGMINALREPPKCGLIMHLSASTKIGIPDQKVLVTTMEHAIRAGVDAVSIHVNLGSKHEPAMLEHFRIADECAKFQIPLLAMVYPRGENITDPYNAEVVSLAARVGAELGADIVKTVYTGDIDSFRKVVDGCPVPVVIAGGPKISSDQDLLKMIKDATDAGAIGCALGRNAFQHEDPTRIVSAVSLIIKEGKNVDEALRCLKL